MATINQIYSLVNKTSNEMWGVSAPSVSDLSGLIALGEKILPNGNWSPDADNYLNSIVDKIGRTVIRTLKRRVDLKNFIKLPFEFGAILEKIDVQPLEAQEDNSWNIGKNDYSTNFFEVYKPNVSSSVFTGIDSWTVHVTIPDVMFRTAFTSESKLSSFYTAILESMTGTIEGQVNKMNHICLSNFIAEKVKAENGVVNLVSLYNDLFNKEVPTGELAQFDNDFMKWASYTINNYVDYIADESVFYNTNEKIRSTSRDNAHIIFLKSFTSAITSHLESGTFHNELVKLPLYDTINYFQFNADTFASRSGINIIPSSEKDEAEKTPVVLSNIIGVIADRMALGTTIHERWSASDRINTERRTNYAEGANIGYFNDLSENGIIFTLN